MFYFFRKKICPKKKPDSTSHVPTLPQPSLQLSPPQLSLLQSSLLQQSPLQLSLVQNTQLQSPLSQLLPLKLDIPFS
jgi:hypothetical protein